MVMSGGAGLESAGRVLATCALICLLAVTVVELVILRPRAARVSAVMAVVTAAAALGLGVTAMWTPRPDLGGAATIAVGVASGLSIASGVMVFTRWTRRADAVLGLIVLTGTTVVVVAITLSIVLPAGAFGVGSESYWRWVLGAGIVTATAAVLLVITALTRSGPERD